jgi:DNA-binding response OmpR family regulator
MKILLLEDDLLLSEVITEHLEESSHSVIQAYTGIEAENLIFEKKFDLLLFDVNVPLLDGFELLKEIREAGNKTPTIFITSMNTSENVSEGFELGADDYLKKPFEMIELKARIDNIKRHFKIEDSAIIEMADGLYYDSSKYLLSVKGEERTLSKKDGEFLLYLLQRRGEVVSTKELMVNVWSYDNSPTEATIRTYVKKLRKLIGEGKITTVWGVGYIYEI